MRKPDEYKHIRCWHQMTGSFEYYIKQVQEQAARENAPLDAIYKTMEQMASETARWVTFPQVTNPGAIYYFEQKGFKHPSAGKTLPTKPDPELTFPPPFILSIEPMEGEAFVHGYHLGTDLDIAQRFAEELFKRHNARTVALKRDDKIIDVYDGEWTSDSAFWHDEEVSHEPAA